MAEYVTEKPKIICAGCKHWCSPSAYGSEEPDWCNAPNLTVWSPVIGRVRYPKCSGVNTGNCAHYEAKTDA